MRNTYWGHLVALKQNEPPDGRPHGKYTCELVLPSAPRSWHVSVTAHHRTPSQHPGGSGPKNKSEIASAMRRRRERGNVPAVRRRSKLKSCSFRTDRRNACRLCHES